ncbi:hypothetical protein pipiens_014174 [Culex pipiens pipiens]|uniref:C2H2-type domain-containing protein n=1 Tax=Culex pipiens pipiens TaxID=38569 RepID=A0ABD1CVJ1_CULPP
MVYYTGLPLLMQQAENNAAASQLCFNNSALTVREASGNGDQQPGQRLQQQFQQQQIVNLSSGTDQPQSYGSFPSGMVPQGSPTGQQQPSQVAKFRCEQCNINFGSKSAHTSHMKSHAKQQQQQEGKSAKTGGQIVTGVVATPATATDPYQCDVCKKTFAVPARLVRHYRTHQQYVTERSAARVRPRIADEAIKSSEYPRDYFCSRALHTFCCVFVPYEERVNVWCRTRCRRRQFLIRRA